jgi:hypothetical protein
MKLQDILSKKLVVDLASAAKDKDLVLQMQTRFKDLGLLLKAHVTGVWDERTKVALTIFCDAIELNTVKTGKLGETFAKKLIELKELPQSKVLIERDYQRAANILGVSVAAIKTVTRVESSGSGFLPSGRPTILFERHLFYDFTQGKHASTCPDICAYNPGGYSGGEAEWNRLEKAAKLDRTAAYRSASWGLFQILGDNFQACGFNNVDDYVAAMKRSEGEQLNAFVNFVISNKLVQYIAKRDWASFARYYNGPNYQINQYDVKLAAAYAEFSRVATA